jgi:hypothetical protein
MADPDFVLCMENSIMPNYISEKIWDGFISDRLVFYLGCPNVKDFIPENTFIFLNDFYDMELDRFDWDGFYEFVESITDEEYEKYILNAREFLKSIKEQHQEEKDKLTKFLIDRINGKK